MQKLKFELSGLTCGACEKISGKRISAIKGVEAVEVSAESGVATIVASRPISLSEVASVLKDTHYQVVSIL